MRNRSARTLALTLDQGRTILLMEMKKIIGCAIVFTAASMSAVLAHDHDQGHVDQHYSPAPAPGPSSAAPASLPVVASMLSASLVSLLAYYLH